MTATTTVRKLTKGEYWAALVLGRFTRVEGANSATGVLLLNGRVVEEGEVTGGWHCMNLTVDGVTYSFTLDSLSTADLSEFGGPLVQSDRGTVKLRFLSDSSESFRELAEAMYD